MKFHINSIILLLLFVVNPYSRSFGKEDKNIIIDECTQTFTYKIKDKKVVVEENTETSYICTQFKSQVTITEFYIDKSMSINNIRIKSKGGNSKPQYRPYFAEKILNTDEKVCFFDLFFARKNETASVKLDRTFLDLHYFNKVFFTESLFARNKTIRFVIPRWMHIEIIPKNIGENVSSTTTYDASDDADIYTYRIRESDAWSRENYVPGSSYVYPHFLIINHYADYKGYREDFFNSLQDLYNWNRLHVLNVENDENTIRQFALELTSGLSSDMEKIKTVFAWVQDNIRYLANNSGMAGYEPEAAQDVLRKKYGDCKGMANLLKHMLKSLGFDARLAWIGTNDIAYDLSKPTIASINHMVCALFLHDQVYYLDATVEYLAFNDYSETIQGRQTLIENGDQFLLDTVPVRDPKQNTETEKSILTIENQSLTGNITHSFKGESKNYFLYSVHGTMKDKLRDELTQYLSKSNAKYELSNLKTSELKAEAEEITLSYEVKNRAGISSYNDKYFINPEFRQYFGNAAIDTTERKLDFWFPHKYDVVQQCEILIPAGMKVESFPENFHLERDAYSFHIEYSQSGNKLFYNRELIIRNPKITKDLFAQWNSDIDRLNACYREQIVLKKKEN